MGGMEGRDKWEEGISGRSGEVGGGDKWEE